MHRPATPSSTSTSTPTLTSTEPDADVTWCGPTGWHTVDEDVTLTFTDTTSAAPPQSLEWRGGRYRVVGPTRYWSTWHCLPVGSAGSTSPTSRGIRTGFWRFAARTDPVAPVLRFEVRGTGTTWRLVRLGAVFDLLEPSSDAGAAP